MFNAFAAATTEKSKNTKEEKKEESSSIVDDYKKTIETVTAEDFTAGPKSLLGDDEDNTEAIKKLAHKSDSKKDDSSKSDPNEMKWDSDVPEIREKHDLGKPYYNKTPYHPEIHFIDSEDFMGHTRFRLKEEDVPSIDIHTIKKGSGRKCLAPEWAHVNYRAYDL